MTKTAVVILNWNGAKLLQQFLPSVLQFSGDATIYVADNASTDTSIAVLKNEFPSIKIISNVNDNFSCFMIILKLNDHIFILLFQIKHYVRLRLFLVYFIMFLL